MSKRHTHTHTCTRLVAVYSYVTLRSTLRANERRPRLTTAAAAMTALSQLRSDKSEQQQQQRHPPPPTAHTRSAPKCQAVCVQARQLARVEYSSWNHSWNAHHHCQQKRERRALSLARAAQSDCFLLHSCLLILVDAPFRFQLVTLNLDLCLLLLVFLVRIPL